jgi:hypothetical protein
MLGVDGIKALAPSGATNVGQEFVRDPVALGQVAQSLLDVLPTKQHTSTEYASLLQTVRANNAAVEQWEQQNHDGRERPGPGGEPGPGDPRPAG